MQARARIAGGLSSSQDTDAVKLYLPGPKRLSHSLTKEFHYEATPQTRGPLLVLPSPGLGLRGKVKERHDVVAVIGKDAQNGPKSRWTMTAQFMIGDSRR